ncbi:hypothetical protein HAX54_038751 [Datura stramonium]|uniref:Uncharacterized protein n=1 Tax=Datura stramonium TaxID=4076 RepID=A0ABS8SIP8_DATST|nr:hypothetical protein [Datura stramonium]
MLDSRGGSVSRRKNEVAIRESSCGSEEENEERCDREEIEGKRVVSGWTVARGKGAGVVGEAEGERGEAAAAAACFAGVFCGFCRWSIGVGGVVSHRNSEATRGEKSSGRFGEGEEKRERKKRAAAVGVLWPRWLSEKTKTRRRRELRLLATVALMEGMVVLRRGRRGGSAAALFGEEEEYGKSLGFGVYVR